MAHTQHNEHEHGQGHGQKMYLVIGAILAVLTAIEVGISLVPESQLGREIMVGILMVLMMIKAALVVLYFMHLKFDSRLFAVLFVFPLLLLAIPMVLVFILLFSGHVGIAG